MNKLFKTISKIFVMVLIAVTLLYVYQSVEAAVTGYKWNTVKYAGGRPIMSIAFINLDSAVSSQSDYDAGYFATFDNQTISMGYLYKAPAGDTDRIIVVTKVYDNILGTSDLTYNVDTQIVIGAASYVYVPSSVTLSLSGHGAEYSVFIENVSQTTANRKNDTLALTFFPNQLNTVPSQGYQEFFKR